MCVFFTTYRSTALFDEHGAWQRHFFGFDGRKIDVVGFEAGAYYNLLSQRDVLVNVRFDGLVLPNGTAVALTREAAVQMGTTKVHVLLIVQRSLPGAGTCNTTSRCVLTFPMYTTHTRSAHGSAGGRRPCVDHFRSARVGSHHAPRV